MTKFDWSKAKNFSGGSEAAYPGGHPRGNPGNVKSWDELERMANQAFPARPASSESRPRKSRPPKHRKAHGRSTRWRVGAFRGLRQKAGSPH